LQYYFSKILRLKLPDSIDESIENNTFGIIIHEVLEQMYKPFAGRLIDPADLQNSLLKLDELLVKSFKKNLNNADFSTGKNLLSFEVAKRYLKQFVEADARKLKTKPRTLVGLEQELTTTLRVENREVRLRGTIDRIDTDKKEGAILLADYKTGKVEKKDLKIKDWETLVTDQKQAKAFQLLFYTYLYQRNNPSVQEVIPGIFSFRNISGGFITTTLPENTELKDAVSVFGNILIEMISEIFDAEVPFVQTENEDACKWCNFKSICNREGSSFF
jgi:ATP-dependent helicase/DNAse subunit B